LTLKKAWAPSASNLFLLYKATDAPIVVLDATTKARRDVNARIGFAAGIKSVVQYIDSRMIGNPDASQFGFED
jgi:hypothetical protein